MHDPLERPSTLQKAADEAIKNGRVVLGLLTYDVENEHIRLDAATSIDPGEVDAILRKFGMTFMVAPCE